MAPEPIVPVVLILPELIVAVPSVRDAPVTAAVEVMAPEPIVPVVLILPELMVAVPSVKEPPVIVLPAVIVVAPDNAPPVNVAVPSVIVCAYNFLLKEASSSTNKRPLRDKSSATIN